MTMARKVSSFVGALILMAQAAVAQSAGVGAWENPSYTTLEWIESQRGLGWYYNWRADEIWQDGNRRRSVEFVPMIHTAANIDDQIRSDPAASQAPFWALTNQTGMAGAIRPE